MKLPPQIAAVAREGRSWAASRSSADGVSASRRHDVNVCVHDDGNPKCTGQVCKCPNGACQCCSSNQCHQRVVRGVTTGFCDCGP
jgi:hypothetical protein